MGSCRMAGGGVGQPNAGSRANTASASRMCSARGQWVGMRSHRHRDRCTSRTGAAMIVSRSALVVTRPSPAALAVERATL